MWRSFVSYAKRLKTFVKGALAKPRVGEMIGHLFGRRYTIKMTKHAPYRRTWRAPLTNLQRYWQDGVESRVCSYFLNCDGMDERESLCLEKIAKTYKEVERQLNLWKETDRHSTEQIQSLRSPLEQLHSCEKANFNDFPLSNYERLKQKLQFKLLKQTECIMAKLQQDL